MRTSRLLLLTPLAALALAPIAGAESTRTLSAELSADPRQGFGVENLAGAMEVVAGPGDKVKVTATVHAESEELAQSLQIAQVSEKGVPTLRVRYPLSKHQAFRYPGGPGPGAGSWWAGLVGMGSTSSRYDGTKVRVSGSSGVLLYADLKVEVPRATVSGTFKNVVGPMNGQGLEGTLRFETGSGPVALAELKGTVTADTGSGNVSARAVSGTFSCDTGSGECRIEGFSGDALKADTGSGAVRVSGSRARRIDVDTGSGNVTVQAADTEEFSADTGSGNVQAELSGKALARVKADTGSGNVTLRLDPGLGFEARADVGSGDVRSQYADAQPIVEDRKVVGWRRGDGHVRIDVDTGSGDVTVEPAK